MQVRGLAILAILVVGGANYVSLAWGAAIQNLSTIAKGAALVLLSTFGALNGAMMSGPRVLFALGQDGFPIHRQTYKLIQTCIGLLCWLTST